MVIYLSGKISGLDATTVRASFDAGTAWAFDHGFRAIDPSLVTVEGWGWDDYMALWHMVIQRVRPHMLFLSGWENSRGAKEEHALAVQLGLPIHYQE